MSDLLTGDELILAALHRDFKRLSRIAEKAKSDCDARISVGSEIIAIHNEFIEIVNTGDHCQDSIKKLETLKNRRERAGKILKKSLIKLMDKQSDAEITRGRLGQEIQTLEFRTSRRNRKAS